MGTINKWSFKKKSDQYLHKKNHSNFFTFFSSGPSTWWMVTSTEQLLLSLNFGNWCGWPRGHLEVTMFNAQQEFHWFNSMYWTSTIHAELCLIMRTNSEQDEVWDTTIFINLSPCAWTAHCLQYYKRQKQTEEEGAEEGLCLDWLPRAAAGRSSLSCGWGAPRRGKMDQKVWQSHALLKIQTSSVGFLCFVHFILTIEVLSKATLSTISLVVQGSGLLTPNAGGMGLIPSQGTRSQVLHGVDKT